MITVIMDIILITEVIITGAMILFITITGTHLSASVLALVMVMVMVMAGIIITGDVMDIITITIIITIMDTMITAIIIMLIMIITTIIQTEIHTREGIPVMMEDPQIITITDQEERTPQVTTHIMKFTITNP